MFGYVTINRGELKVKDYDLYRSFYCALCHSLKKRYGKTGQMLLNYDMTFLSILLDSLYELPERRSRGRCLVHPAERHSETWSEASDYAADMTVLLYYQKAMDDWKDDHSVPGRTLALQLYKHYRRLRLQYPRQAKALERSLRKLGRAEKGDNANIDQIAGYTGDFLGEMFVWKKDDVWAKDLRMLGFYLGKFIYLIDALDDMDKDEKRGNYNLLLVLRARDPEHFYERTEKLLVDVMSYAARAFERLPVLKNTDILRNILYSGVWVRYRQILDRRR